MTPGHLLAKRHGIADYLAVVSPTPAGFVYVETDRYLPSPAPDIISEDEDSIKSKLQTWAEEPLEEIRFLKRIVEGQAQESDGVNPGQGALMKGCVIYAPFHVSPHIFQTYLHIAQEVAGPELWNKVVGFRYLLQGKKEGQVQTLVSSDHWLQNILSLSQGRNGRGWTFDVGVDVNRDGEAGLLAVGDMVREVRKRENGTGRSVKFIMSTFPFLYISFFAHSTYFPCEKRANPGGFQITCVNRPCQTLRLRRSGKPLSVHFPPTTMSL
jgi:hypothetical protein